MEELLGTAIFIGFLAFFIWKLGDMIDIWPWVFKKLKR
jgi:hypothetical protein